MGAMKEVKNARRGKRTSSRKRKETEADWSKANAEYVYYIVSTAAKLGGAAFFGRTRDRNTYIIKLYIDGDAWTDYVEGSEDVNQRLREIIADLDGAD